MMDPPKALLELSFLEAVHDLGHEQHEVAATEYLRLVDRFQREEVLLVAVSDHAQRFPGMNHALRQIGLRRTGVFAPVDFLWVGYQHRRAARRAAQTHGIDTATALTLTMAQRHRIRHLVTLDARFEEFELTIMPSPSSPPSSDDGTTPEQSVITDIVDS